MLNMRGLDAAGQGVGLRADRVSPRAIRAVVKRLLQSDRTECRVAGELDATAEFARFVAALLP